MNGIPPTLDPRSSTRPASPSVASNPSLRPEGTSFRLPNNPPPPPPPPALSAGNIIQFLGVAFERIAAQAASFFKGNQKDTVDEEFEDRWEQNEIASPELFDEKQIKVQDAGESSNIGRQ